MRIFLLHFLFMEISPAPSHWGWREWFIGIVIVDNPFQKYFRKHRVFCTFEALQLWES